MTIDPRMAARRTRVAEGRAKSDLRRLLWLAGTAAAIGGVIWLLFSPYLSVNRIAVFGATNAEVSAALAEEGVTEGRPLVAIRSGRVEARLEADPWVRDASVELVFPDLVEVTVAERTSAAWINVASGWAEIASDGTVVGYADTPPEGAPIVRFTTTDPGLGMPLENTLAVGAVAFIGALPDRLADSLVVREDAGEMWASVLGRTVRLGTSVDMEAKAAAVAAVMEQGTALTVEEPGGVIDVIAPSRPAVWSTSQVEVGTGEVPDLVTDGTETSESGTEAAAGVAAEGEDEANTNTQGEVEGEG